MLGFATISSQAIGGSSVGVYQNIVSADGRAIGVSSVFALTSVTAASVGSSVNKSLVTGHSGLATGTVSADDLLNISLTTPALGIDYTYGLGYDVTGYAVTMDFNILEITAGFEVGKYSVGMDFNITRIE